MGKQAASPMPAHLRGRGTQRGPMAGGYVTWAVTVDNIANSEDPEFSFVAPADLRIMEISTGAEAATAGSGLTMTAVNGSTSLVAAYTITTTPTVNAFASSAARDMSKGDLLHINIAAAADADATGLAVFITAYILGHVQADSADD